MAAARSGRHARGAARPRPPLARGLQARRAASRRRRGAPRLGEDFRPSAEILAARLYGSGAGPGLVAEGRAALEDLAAARARPGRLAEPPLQGPSSRSRRRGARRPRRGPRRPRRSRGRAARCRRGAAARSRSRLGLAAAALQSADRLRSSTGCLDAAGIDGGFLRRRSRVLLARGGARKEDGGARPRADRALRRRTRSPLRVKLPAAEWETIFRNLFANALASPRLGLLAEERRDPVTGQARDASSSTTRDPRPLTAEMIRGRAAERGLGVVADVVRRWDGAVDVVPPAPPGYTKGVSVEFADRGGGAVTAAPRSRRRGRTEYVDGFTRLAAAPGADVAFVRAGSLAEARAALRGRRPDAVFLDVVFDRTPEVRPRGRPRRPRRALRRRPRPRRPPPRDAPGLLRPRRARGRARGRPRRPRVRLHGEEKRLASLRERFPMLQRLAGWASLRHCP